MTVQGETLSESPGSQEAKASCQYLGGTRNGPGHALHRFLLCSHPDPFCTRHAENLEVVQVFVRCWWSILGINPPPPGGGYWLSSITAMGVSLVSGRNCVPMHCALYVYHCAHVSYCWQEKRVCVPMQNVCKTAFAAFAPLVSLAPGRSGMNGHDPLSLAAVTLFPSMIVRARKKACQTEVQQCHGASYVSSSNEGNVFGGILQEQFWDCLLLHVAALYVLPLVSLHRKIHLVGNPCTVALVDWPRARCPYIVGDLARV